MILCEIHGVEGSYVWPRRVQPQDLQTALTDPGPQEPELAVTHTTAISPATKLNSLVLWSNCLFGLLNNSRYGIAAFLHPAEGVQRAEHCLSIKHTREVVYRLFTEVRWRILVVICISRYCSTELLVTPYPGLSSYGGHILHIKGVICGKVVTFTIDRCLSCRLLAAFASAGHRCAAPAQAQHISRRQTLIASAATAEAVTDAVDGPSSDAANTQQQAQQRKAPMQQQERAIVVGDKPAANSLLRRLEQVSSTACNALAETTAAVCGDASIHHCISASAPHALHAHKQTTHTACLELCFSVQLYCWASCLWHAVHTCAADLANMPLQARVLRSSCRFP